MNAIEIQSLKKTYDSGDEALKGINLNIPKGSFYGLLGPNGAGKTTTIGILTGLINKSSGITKIMDYDTIYDFKKARKLIGLSPQEIFCPKLIFVESNNVVNKYSKNIFLYFFY